MDIKQQLVPIGVMGELVVAGDGLARGYTDPALDVDRFVEVNVDGKIVRAYRTGDRVRYRPQDRQIEFFGRIDQQIKIRGYRVELAEVEHAMLNHCPVKDAIVVLRQQDNAEKEMIAFAVAWDTTSTKTSHTEDKANGHIENDLDQSSRELERQVHRQLQTALPAYMVPSRVVILKEMPLNANGKVDRKVLSQMAETAPKAAPIVKHVAPRDEMEQALCDEYSAVLGVDISIYDNFFEIGGHSLLAMKLAARLSSRLHAIISIKDIFDHPELADLAATIRRGSAAHMPIEHKEYTSPVEQSFAQGRLWFIDQLNLGALWYLVPIATRLRGPLNIDALAAALHALEQRHEILRTTFEEHNGIGVQIVQECRSESLRTIDASDEVEVLEMVKFEQTRPFDLTSEPGWRVCLIRINDDDHVLSIVMHHIASDGWSVDVLRGELDQFYALAVRGEEPLSQVATLPIQYRDFAVWQRQAEQVAEQKRQLDYWTKKLADSAPAELICDRPRPEVLSGEAGYIPINIDGSLHDSVRGATALLNQGADEDTELVAYITLEQDTDATTPNGEPFAGEEGGVRILPMDLTVEVEIRTSLKISLPAYMIPARIIAVNHIPMNSNGKIDRPLLRQLNLPSTLGQTTREKVEPRDEMEKTLCEEFANVLGQDVGVTDDFFELGGHSLMATKLAARLSRRLSAKVSVRDVFDHPILSDLAATIQQGSETHVAIPRLEQDGPVEQSFAQGRLWFLDKLNLGASYIMPLVTRLRGQLSINALTCALHALEQRHESLRTTFEDHADIGMQVVQPFRPLNLHVHDVSARTEAEIHEELKADQARPFDLAKEPGWRVCLYRVSRDDHILSVLMHHIISDGWSMDILRRELDIFYSATLRGEEPQVVPLPIQYRDFAVWQKQEEQVAEQERQLNYWTMQLSNSAPAELICDRPRPKVLSGEGDYIPINIDGSMYENLQAYCRAQQVTPFVVLLAAFRATHYRLTGTEDATIGSPIANRNRPELEHLIGFFVNTQCMRITVSNDDTFQSLVQQVRSTATAAFANQDVPFEQIVSALLPGSRDTSRNPLVQLMFAVHAQKDLGRLQLEGLESELLSLAPTTRLDVEFHMFQENDCLSGIVMYALDLFEKETIKSILAVFYEALRRGLSNPRTPVATLPLTDGLSELRSQGLLDIQRPEYPRESSIIDVFRDQAAFCPEAVAVKDSLFKLTYAELDRKSDELASWLHKRQRPLAPETLVGVLAPRSCETIVAFLGILKAGLAYLPLDVNVPTTRIETILSAVSGHKLVLFGSDTQHPEMSLPDVELIPISNTLGHVGTERTTTASSPSAKSLAYVIFTSGSTGKPKGVMIEHRNVVRLVKNSNVVNRQPRTARIAHLSNLAFDASTWEIYAALLNGGTIVCIDYFTTLDTQALSKVFMQEKIRGAMFPPALLKQCLATAPSSMLSGLDVLFAAGDRLDGQDAVKAQAHVPQGVYNAYGPTENAVLSTIYNVRPKDRFVGSVPIGRPVSNSGAYVMDAQQQLVSIGVMGELVVTGDGLSRGYTDPKLNIGRMAEVTIDGQRVRAYCTGDRVRVRPRDGQIEFFGRMDFQIKVRGHRVEPAEIENAMLGCDEVDDAAIVIRHEEGQEPEMFGFITAGQSGLTGQATNGSPNDSAERFRRQLEKEVHKRLQATLPPYMVPAQIRALPQMPVNANGKVDRRELSRQVDELPTREEERPRMLPQNDAETILYEELNYLLGRDFDMGDDFFELGGHSLTAMKLATRLGRRLNASVAVKDIFDYPILTDLAAAIQQGTSPHRAIVPMGYSGPVEQSFAQGRLWFLDQLNVKAMWYIIPLATRLRGPLNVDALNAALQALEQRHETLRTTFEEHSGIGVQVVHARRSGGLRIVDASTYTKAGVLDAVKAEQTRPFDLAVEPGWRVCLLRISESDNILSVVMHHIISDGWSVDVLRRELDVFYTAALRGERGEELSSQIPALPIQYRDFALWQKQADQVAEQQRQLDYWTKQLTDSTPAEFLCDKPRPDILSGQAGVAPVFITGALYESLQAYCRAQQVTPFVVLLAAFRATHYRLTGTEDATIGTPIANRNRPELENLIGFFVNTQAMRITITEESFEGLVQQVRHTATQAFANQDVPFEQLVSALLPGRRDASRNPLVQLTFAVHSQRDLGRLRFEGVQGELIPIALTTRFDLEFHLFQEENCLSGNVLYASELFEAATVESMLGVFHEVLRRGLHNPETPIGTLPLTDGVSRLRNEGLLKEPKTDYPRESSIVDVFREQVTLYPNALAVKDSSTELTYTELDRYSDDLAGWLCRRKMAPETLVGVLSTRSCQTITAFLGILKAGLAYLPLDINVPTARIETILRAISGHKLALLGTDIRRPDIMLPDVEMVLIAETLGHAGTTTTILPTPSATSLAYVIFTSGSTGKPKGVMVEHRERCLVESLEEYNDTTQNWIAAAREKAERCPALSAADLVELGKEAGLRVELSWARQRSQSGAVDAVFHNYQSRHDGGRVLIQFPADDDNQVPNSRTNRPLQGLQSRRIEAQVRDRLQISLPGYMVPSRIVVLDQMPFNSNRKVDRKELAKRAKTVTKSRLSRERVTPRNEMESVLCEEFTNVLGVAVSVTENFFELGGHSLMATKLASSLGRRLNTSLSVRDIFSNPVLADLASELSLKLGANGEAEASASVQADSAPFELLQVGDRSDFVQNEITPQLGDRSAKVLDVYPPTQVQKRFLHDPTTGNPRVPPVFIIDFPSDTDCERLASSCGALVQHFDIFRTTFVSVKGTLHQVVLENLAVPIEVIETDSDITSATRSVVDMDLKQPLRLGQSLLRIAILKRQPSTVRVILRMSHALYDGLSFEHIVLSLHALHNGNTLTTPSRFARYIQHMVQSRALGYNYWGSVLQHSSMSVIPDVRRNLENAPRLSGTYIVEKTIPSPFLARYKITPATVFTTACAIMLAKETGSTDLLFGRVVSGRQNLPSTSQNIVGPCTNEVPVRVLIDENATLGDVLQNVQSQYVDSLPFETLGFDDLKGNCTDWPASTTDFGACTTFQNYEMRPQSQIHGQSIRLDGFSRHDDEEEAKEGADGLTRMVLRESPLHSVEITGIPEAESSRLRVIVNGNLGRFEEKTVERILEELCRALALLTGSERVLMGDALAKF
ncbi:AMP-binding-domain-containing protein [Lindgomyces ingoldianus]|uniref:AMP-binding-domain-containing protein n=1 Tax=Lindgomyces ingoldianus TaxID=673940 RepID=A0ACB6Q9B0_9PLEO|nr:AMP-binding-domain-containing protein [Lindgomyces ingoldianus]KAF2462697.1 AMP-binding-domain-containing protein [Lindgomyces ingoldianus]